MDHYVDGFVFPVSRDGLDIYRIVAQSGADIWTEHGALEYSEFVIDDPDFPGTRSFVELVQASAAEVVVIGWIKFASRESRDLVHKKVAADPRMPHLIAPLTDPANPVFDATRMAYGGFHPLVQSTQKDA
ncbi:MAG: DUF1428 domain-containing protein [Gammaproteobacteria bacterium]